MMESAEQTAEQLDLREYGLLLWRRRWLVLGIVVATVAAVAVATLLATPIYRAEVTVQVNAAATRPRDMDPFSGLFVSREAVPTFIELINTPFILDKVAANLDLAAKGKKLGKVKATRVGQTEFFRVSVDNPDREVAQAVANEVVRVVMDEAQLEWVQRAAMAELLQQVQVRQLEQEIGRTRAALNAAPDAASRQLLSVQLSGYEGQYATALNTLQETQMARARVTDVLTVRAPALLPTHPVSPRPLLNLALGLALGMGTGLGAALLLEFLDRRLESPEQVRRLLGTPVIGALPMTPKGKEESDLLEISGNSDDAELEPYHRLRLNIHFSSREPGAKVWLATSAVSGEGKTTVVSNLGAALALAGNRVLLVDADFRRPRLHRRFGMTRGEGLAELLAEEDPHPERLAHPTSVKNLSVLMAGTAIARPSLILTGPGSRVLFDRLRGLADIVLVDSPPVLYSSDALVLADMVDRVFLVISSGTVKTEAVQKAQEALGMANAKQVDVVLNRVRRGADAYVYYYYDYYRSYRPDPEGAE